MNKYKEAKAWLDKINANPHWNRVDIEEPALSQLNELFERATPKKPKKYITPYNYIEFECPNCHTVTHTNFIRPYCGECGQALDWSEDDES